MLHLLPWLTSLLTLTFSLTFSLFIALCYHSSGFKLHILPWRLLVRVCFKNLFNWFNTKLATPELPPRYQVPKDTREECFKNRSQRAWFLHLVQLLATSAVVRRRELLERLVLWFIKGSPSRPCPLYQRIPASSGPGWLELSPEITYTFNFFPHRGKPQGDVITQMTHLNLKKAPLLTLRR